MTRLKAAIDIGGTLEEIWSSKRSWFKSIGVDIGSKPMERDSIISTPGVGREQYDEMRRWVYSSEQIPKHESVAGARDALSQLSVDYEITLLSSRTEEFRGVTYKWLQSKSMERSISALMFLGDLGNKFQWCVDNNISLMIDDDSRHLGLTSNTGPKLRIHFKNGFGQSPSTSPYVRSAATWIDVLHIVKTLEF